MFDKYKKYKIISAVVFIIILTIFLLSNLKIQSVESYQDEHKNNGYVAIESTSDSLLAIKNETSVDRTILSKETKEEKTDTQVETLHNEAKKNLEETLPKSEEFSLENETTTALSEKLESDNNQKDDPNYNQASQPDFLDKTQLDTTTREPVSQIQYITCSIEIRCDKAVELKESIKNEGVKNLIPPDGTIIKKTSYKIPVGQKVYDFLMQACVDNNILVSANNGYVTSINNLSEKATSYASGWMYKVNDISPNVGSLSYTLKDGDVVLWYYVDNYKDG